MKLTGKCELAFFMWDVLQPHWHEEYSFIELSPSMQYGVYVDFSETVHKKTNHNMVEAEQSYIAGGHSRSEARTFTVEKFNKRYNK